MNVRYSFFIDISIFVYLPVYLSTYLPTYRERDQREHQKAFAGIQG